MQRPLKKEPEFRVSRAGAPQLLQGRLDGPICYSDRLKLSTFLAVVAHGTVAVYRFHRNHVEKLTRIAFPRIFHNSIVQQNRKWRTFAEYATFLTQEIGNG